MHGANFCKIDLVTYPNAIAITRSPIANNVPEIIPMKRVKAIIPITINSKSQIPAVDKENWKYRFNTMVQVSIEMFDNTKVNFDLQEVINQPTWTANLAGQQNCVTALSLLL